MPRGYPDYNNPFYSIAAQSADFAQIMSIFTGIRQLDNLGYLIYADVFREGLRGWGVNSMGLAFTPAVNQAAAEVPPVGLIWYIVAGTTGFNASITKGFANDLRTRWGMDTAVLLPTQFPEFHFRFFQRIDGDALAFDFRINTATKILEADHEGVWIPVSPDPLSILASTYLPIKFVVDFEDRSVPRVMIGGARFSLDGEWGTVTHPGGNLFYTVATILVNNPLNVNSFAYMGHVFITVDEP